VESVTIVEVQLSEYLYGHRIKRVADHLLKVVACSNDRVPLAALKKVQRVWRFTDKKNDEHAVKVLKKSFECTKVQSTRAKEIKPAKDARFIYNCCGLWRREAMQCATLYWLGVRPSCLECVRAKIDTGLKSFQSPKKDTV
jgi:hypothetical protein